MKVDIYVDYKFRATADAVDAEAFYAVSDIEGVIKEFGRSDTQTIDSWITFVAHGDPAPGPLDPDRIEGT